MTAREFSIDQFQWHGCYAGGWRNEIVPEAFAHPAKVSRVLIRRIYEHAIAEGWLNAGDTVVDGFGGIAGTGLDAMLRGMHWIGVELEPRFVDLAQQNIDLWQRKYGAMPGLGSVRIVQGDSRKLADVIGEAGLVVSSPPYAASTHDGNGIDRSKLTGNVHGKNSQVGNEGYGQSAGQLGAMKEGEAPALVISSPPYVSGGHHPDQTGAWGGKAQAVPRELAGYGPGDGQLGRMKDGAPPACIISSPPYAAIAVGAGGLNTKPGKDGQQSGRSADSASQQADNHYGEAEGQLSTMREGSALDCIISSPPFVQGRQNTTASAGGIASQREGDTPVGVHYGQWERNGNSEGQLGEMPEGDVDAVIGSPPFEAGADGVLKKGKFKDPVAFAAGMSSNSGGGNNHARTPEAALRQLERDADKVYGDTKGNIGNNTGDTFWSAARDIVAQCHQILKPGGHAIWVTKDFVRKGKRVPFSDQWQALCEQVGFRLVCRHQAMLVAHYGEQGGLFGNDKQLTTSRKSFFRRLAESKGSPEINHEDVICMVKS